MTEVPTPITTVIDGIEVRGIITAWCINDICVQITHPFVGLCTGVHMMAEALGFRNYLGEAGVRRAKGLLHELYDLGRKAERRAGALRKRLVTYDAACAVIDARRQAILAERIEVRAAFKAAQIDQSIHQSTRKRLENALLELESTQHQMQDEHLFSRLPADIALDDREQLLTFIRSVCANKPD